MLRFCSWGPAQFSTKPQGWWVTHQAWWGKIFIESAGLEELG